MQLRNSSQFELAAKGLIDEHKPNLNNVDLTKTKIISAYWVPASMVTRKGEWHLQAVGGVWLMAILFLVLFLTRGLPIVGAPALIGIPTLIIWLSVRSYYETKLRGAEYLILLGASAPDSVIAHELAHIQLGHLEGRKPRWTRILVSPAGPVASLLSSFGYNECEARVYVREKLGYAKEGHGRLPGFVMFFIVWLALLSLVSWALLPLVLK